MKGEIAPQGVTEVFPYAYLDGEVVPEDQAKVHVMTPSVRYASSVFEVVRGYWSSSQEQLYLLQLERHAQRLIDSARLMRLDEEFDEDDVCTAMLSLLQHLEPRQDVMVWTRIFVDGRGPVDSSGPVRLCSVAIPATRGFGPKWVDGLNACVSSWQRIDERSAPPRIKTASNYQNSRLAQMEARLNGYDTAVLLNSVGKVAEGPGACLIMMRRGVLATPPITASILEGITRETVLELMRDAFGREVLEREIDRTELYLAEELFLCGTGAEIAPIISVDRHTIGTGRIGELTARLRDTYLGIARGTSDAYAEWRRPVFE